MDSTEDFVEPDFVGEERARELYQYYRPPTPDNPEAVFLPFPDTVLQAHAQLTACRLDFERAIISVVDKQTQYCIGEATKTSDLEDNGKGDDLSYRL